MIERTLMQHKLNGLNEVLNIRVTDEPGAGNACHRYKIDGPVKDWGGGIGKVPEFQCDIKFQNGPIAEAGVNGISNEALLAVVIDRLEGFQSGQYKCRENAIALTKLEEAMHWLQHRTRARLARGVEGTSKQ